METIEQRVSSPEFMKEFQRGRLELELTELICRLMEERKISRAELSRRIGTSRANVTQLLRDGSNMTVKTISDIFFALGSSLRVLDRPLSIWSRELLVVEVSDSAYLQPPEPEVSLDEEVSAPNFKLSHGQPQYAAPKSKSLYPDAA